MITSRSYRGSPSDPERRRAFENLQVALAGLPILSAIAALGHSLAFAAAYATDDFAAADRLLDGLLPDIKKHIRLNAAEIAENKAKLSISAPGRA